VATGVDSSSTTTAFVGTAVGGIGVKGRQKPRIDVVLGVRASDYRRVLLLDLLEHGRVELGTRTGAIADGSGVDPENLQPELFHVNLPKLEAAGSVECDRKNDAIEPGPRFEEVSPMLELLNDHADELPDGWL
jgi:hypothetical protein